MELERQDHQDPLEQQEAVGSQVELDLQVQRDPLDSLGHLGHKDHKEQLVQQDSKVSQVPQVQQEQLEQQAL